jgi:hypothetical protein
MPFPDQSIVSMEQVVYTYLRCQLCVRLRWHMHFPTHCCWVMQGDHGSTVYIR